MTNYKDNKHYKQLVDMFGERYLSVYKDQSLWVVEINEDKDGAFCAESLEEALEDAWATIQYEEAFFDQIDFHLCNVCEGEGSYIENDKTITCKYCKGGLVNET